MQGHTALKIVNFDPNWAFPDCISSLESPMAPKWCTKLEVALKRCPIVFSCDQAALQMVFSAVEQTPELLVIWDAMMPMWHRSNEIWARWLSLHHIRNKLCDHFLDISFCRLLKHLYIGILICIYNNHIHIIYCEPITLCKHHSALLIWKISLREFFIFQRDLWKIYTNIFVT